MTFHPHILEIAKTLDIKCPGVFVTKTAMYASDGVRLHWADNSAYVADAALGYYTFSGELWPPPLFHACDDVCRCLRVLSRPKHTLGVRSDVWKSPSVMSADLGGGRETKIRVDPALWASTRRHMGDHVDMWLIAATGAQRIGPRFEGAILLRGAGCAAVFATMRQP